MDGDELANTARRGSARIGRCFHGGDVAADDGSHVASADLLPPDESDLRRLDHGVSRLNHRDQALRLDHPERLTHRSPRVDEPDVRQSLKCLIASAIRAVSSPYVS